MTYEDKQKELFFETLEKMSTPSRNWLLEEDIIKNVAPKITIKTAKELFKEFNTGDIKYIEDELMERFRVSDAGRVYHNFLKSESEKVKLEKDSIQSSIDTNKFSRKSTRFSIGVGLLVLGMQGYTIYRDIHKDKEATSKVNIGQQQQERIIQTDSLSNQELHQISLSLQDTAKVKVKIEK
jgi:hypothetical protein